MMYFNFAPILKGLPMPDGLHQPRRAPVDIVEHEGAQMYRVILHGPDDSPTCFGLGMTPETALRSALFGLLRTLNAHGLGNVDTALAYVRRLTLN